MLVILSFFRPPAAPFPPLISSYTDGLEGRPPSQSLRVAAYSGQLFAMACHSLGRHFFSPAYDKRSFTAFFSPGFLDFLLSGRRPSSQALFSAEKFLSVIVFIPIGPLLFFSQRRKYCTRSHCLFVDCDRFTFFLDLVSFSTRILPSPFFPSPFHFPPDILGL